MSLLLEKITPPTGLPRITRTRLLKALQESLPACASTIVCGRVGTGKSMLAVDFARRCRRRVAWYKIEAADGELLIFFQYLTESVRLARPNFEPERLMRLAADASRENASLLAEAFVYELQESEGEPLLIIMDDLHLIYDATWLMPFLRRLLPLLPPTVHVLITGRSLPPAPLWRMRSKQTLCVIEEATLTFTFQEARQLLRAYHLTRAQVEEALQATRGRAAALDQLAISLGAIDQSSHENHRAAQ